MRKRKQMKWYNITTFRKPIMSCDAFSLVGKSAVDLSTLSFKGATSGSPARRKEHRLHC